MKAAQLIFGLAAAAISAHACLTVHTYQDDCIYNVDDVVDMQVWDNGEKKCGGGAGEGRSLSKHRLLPGLRPCELQSATHRHQLLTVLQGNKVYTWDNLERLKYHRADGYEINLEPRHIQETEIYCGSTGQGEEIKGTKWEAVYWTDDCPGKCRLPGFCDYRSYCPGFLASCY